MPVPAQKPRSASEDRNRRRTQPRNGKNPVRGGGENNNEMNEMLSDDSGNSSIETFENMRYSNNR